MSASSHSIMCWTAWHSSRCVFLLVGIFLGLNLAWHGSTFDADGAAGAWRLFNTKAVPDVQPLNSNLTGTDVEFHRLLRKAAAAAPQGLPNTVVVAEVNSGFFSMALNLYQQLQRVEPPLSNIVWVALDAPAKARMDATFEGALIFYDAADNTTFAEDSRLYRTPEYNKIVLHKWTLVQRVLALGFNVLVMDVDYVVLRNPLSYIQATPPACDLTLYDQTLPVIEGYKKWVKRERPWKQFEINTGFMLLRNTPGVRDLIRDFLNSPKPPGQDDQLLFNNFMRERVWSKQRGGLQFPVNGSSTQCIHWSGGLSARLLPFALFGSWHAHALNLHEWTQEVPYVLHYNWLTGFEAKKAMMKRHGYWLLNDTLSAQPPAAAPVKPQ